MRDNTANIDLHVHSTFSDGTFTPEQLVEHAVGSGIRAMALTDHDTVAGLQRAFQAASNYKDVFELIPGTELSVAHGNGDIHIVGLFIDPEHPAFIEQSKELIARRNRRNDEMLERFQADGIPLTKEQLVSQNPDTVVTRAHFAKALIELGLVQNADEAFSRYLNRNTKYYVPRKFISPKEGITLILQAGGIPILAHPLQYHLSAKERLELIEELISYGLAGIEVKYSTHSKQDEYMVSQIASKYHLLRSGGSDFHGKNKPDIQLGSGLGNLHVPYEYAEQMIQFLEKQNVY